MSVLTQAQTEYILGATPFEIGKRHGIKGLKEITQVQEKALTLALSGRIRDQNLLRRLLELSPLSGYHKAYLGVFLDLGLGLDKAVVYSAFVSCLASNYVYEWAYEFKDFMGKKYPVYGYRLRYALNARSFFHKVVFPNWKKFLPLIKKGVKLRMIHSYKKGSVLKHVRERWGELGEVLCFELEG